MFRDCICVKHLSGANHPKFLIHSHLLNASTINTATTQIFEIHEIKHNSYKKNEFSIQNRGSRETQRKRDLFTGAPILVTM